MRNLDTLFDDKRILCVLIAGWTACVSIIFVCIMIDDNSPFLSFGPNERTVLFGFKLDTWTKWGCIAMYTFVSTCIADFTGDAVGPFVTNTIQDHKNLYLPYSKTTCVLIVQVFAVYAIIMNIIGLFVALSQIDFILIRMSADLMVNYYTCNRFMRYKSVNKALYDQYMLTHCVESLHFSNGNGVVDDDASSACTVEVRPAISPQRAGVPTASPCEIRKALSEGSRTPSSDHFDGMQRQVLVPVTPETAQRYASTDKPPLYPSGARDDTLVLYSPSDKEDEKTRLFGSQHYS